MNLKHLRYFWTVARMGSVARASERLHLTPQTVSAQVKMLEEALGVALFRPAGRGLELTEAGQVALSYADEILDLGDEMKAALTARREQPRPIFHVGITDVVPKSLAYRLLAPVYTLPEPVRLICREGPMDLLLAELALHRLDMIIADRPMPEGLAVRGHGHKLCESAIAFFAAPELACTAFPACLDAAPLLLPGATTAVRGQIEHWLGESRLNPNVAGEFDDGALMKAFGQAGVGFFPAPAILAEEIAARYGVREVGRVENVREAFWLITGERHISHPAVRAVVEAAHNLSETIVPARFSE
ncbi:MAG: transcriptional activator NhaR [Sulfuricellaceae bacterium]|nr:transcriptional activator NhaR [Sulfuricellaceae bacterium]